MSVFVRLASLALLFFLSSAVFLRAERLATAAGHWEGSIDVPDNPVLIEIDLATGPGGALTGTFSNPAKNLRGLPLANVVAHDASVAFEIPGTPGGTFRGTLSADGKSMTGTFSITSGAPAQTVELPYRLARTGDARIEPIPRSPRIGKDLEGEWTGTLDVNGTKKTLVLRMANHPDGTATGSIVSEELEVAITRIEENGKDVTLDVKAVGGSYSATLAPARRELTGTWTQGPFSAPLTFRRASAP